MKFTIESLDCTGREQTHEIHSDKIEDALAVVRERGYFPTKVTSNIDDVITELNKGSTPKTQSMWAKLWEAFLPS